MNQEIPEIVFGKIGKNIDAGSHPDTVASRDKNELKGDVPL
jgi:hypothetical protein